MSTNDSQFEQIRDDIRQFVTERDWAQFHTPKNLATALCVEAAELLEHFQWLQNGSRAELGEEKRQQVQHEMADVMVYLMHLAEQLDVDLFDAVREKMVLNRIKYPAEQVRGDARKYDEYKK